MRQSWKLFAAILAAAWTYSAQAHPDVPLWVYFQHAEDIYLVKVSGTSRTNVTFVVTDVLRGKNVTKMDLLVGSWPQTYLLNSEWILASVPITQVGEGHGDYVGREMEGDDGWVPGQIVRFNGKPFLKEIYWSSEGSDLDPAPDGTKGLTLDHVKQLLQKMPYKPEH